MEHNWRMKSETAREERRKRVEEWERCHAEEEEGSRNRIQKSNKKVMISLDEEVTEDKSDKKQVTKVASSEKYKSKSDQTVPHKVTISCIKRANSIPSMSQSKNEGVNRIGLDRSRSLEN